MSFLNTSITGLLAAQRGLATTSHNIANVNTPGYSRQRNELTTLPAQYTGSGYVGKGVLVSSIQRVHSEFVTEQVRTSTSSASSNQAFLELASRIDDIVANEDAGLSPSLISFFNSVQDVADLPSSINNRQVMVSEAQSLITRFHFVEQRISDIGNDVRLRLNDSITETNTLTQSIADINQRISSSFGDPNRQPPNDLLDERDELLRQLSEMVSISTVEQTDGAINVFTGSGQALVIGSTENTLQLTETYLGHYEISVTNGSSSSIVTDNISGGQLGGILDFQSSMLEPTVNALGRLAIGLADSFNDQHTLGINLDNEINTSFFTVPSARVTPLGTAPNNVSATIVDPNSLTTSDYNLLYNGGNSYTLTRLSDNTTTAINTGGASPFTTTAIDGFTLTITAGATAGDQFIVQPTINGARLIDMALTDPRKIAAAGALQTAEATNVNGLPSNTGTAQISSAQIANLTGIPLASAITLTFNQATNQFTISAPPGGTLAYNPATENSGKQFTIAAAGNASFTISGFPDDGDQFVIGNNTNSEGDNRNVLLLANLQNSNTLINGSATYQDAYSQMVVDIGSRTRQSEVSDSALTALLEQATETRESLSGVNLDEEAAKLLELQQFYQASAQMISTADLLFQTLIESV